MFGCIVGAFRIAAPGNVSFSSLFEEFLGNLHGVFFLVSQVVYELIFEILSHLLESMLDFSFTVSHYVSLFSSFTSVVKFNIASGFFGTIRAEHMFNVHFDRVASFIILKAGDECFRIALDSWFNPLSEGTNNFALVFDNSNLRSADLVDHLVSGCVKVLSNFSDFFLL